VLLHERFARVGLPDAEPGATLPINGQYFKVLRELARAEFEERVRDAAVRSGTRSRQLLLWLGAPARRRFFRITRRSSRLTETSAASSHY
jgi:hypothetical protein